MKNSMYDQILYSANKYPNRIAYIYEDIKKTYKAFLNEIDEVSFALINLGVGQYDVVSVCLPNCPQAVILLYAINKIGAICNLIDPSSPLKEINKILNDTSSKIIFTIDTSYDKVLVAIEGTAVSNVVITTISDPLSFVKKNIYNVLKGGFNPFKKFKKMFFKIFDNIEIMSWHKFTSNNKKNRDYVFLTNTSSDPSVIITTFGFYGNPKGALFSNEAVNLKASSFYNDIRFSKDSTLINTIVIANAFSLVSCHSAFSNGFKVLLIPKFDSNKLKDILLFNKSCYLFDNSSFYKKLIDNDFYGASLKNINEVFCIDNSLSDNLRKEINSFFKKYSSLKLKVCYNVPELLGLVGIDSSSFFVLSKSVTLKIYKTYMDDALALNETGEICFSSASAMLGYFNDPKEQEKVFRYHDDLLFFHTGDAGYLNSSDKLVISSRIKRVLVYNGYDIYPGYIEKVLLLHPLVFSCLVVGVNAEYGSYAKAYITLRRGYVENEKIRNDIYEHCKKYLMKYAIPKEFVYEKEKNKKIVGKISYIEQVNEKL